MRILITLLLLILMTAPVYAFGGSGDGCGAGDCRDCHSLELKEAKQILAPLGIKEIKRVEFSEMPGLFAVDVEQNGQKFPIFLDFSKKYIVAGQIVRLSDGTDIARERIPQQKQEKKPKFVDVGKIPLTDALLVGRQDAPIKVIVFTDPECPYCGKLHHELEKVVAKNRDIAYMVKMMPLPFHKFARPIAQRIVCDQDMKLLEESFAAIEIADREQKEAALARLAAVPASCDVDFVDQNIALARELGITGTPTLVYPNGLVDSGAKPADKLIEIALGAAKAAK